MDGTVSKTPECDSIDIMLLKECCNGEYVKLVKIASSVGVPNTVAWHRLTVLVKFGYAESNLQATYFKANDRGKRVCE